MYGKRIPSCQEQQVAQSRAEAARRERELARMFAAQRDATRGRVSPLGQSSSGTEDRYLLTKERFKLLECTLEWLKEDINLIEHDVTAAMDKLGMLRENLLIEEDLITVVKDCLSLPTTNAPPLCQLDSSVFFPVQQ